MIKELIHSFFFLILALNLLLVIAKTFKNHQNTQYLIN